MRTRSSSNLIVESFTIPKRRNRRCSKQIVEPELRTIVETPVATMADTRTMSKLLQAPTEGYRDAIFIPPILVENFELKVGLLTLTTNLKNDITIFQQRFDETFTEAWDRFKDLLRKFPHHDFLELHQIDTFYNALTQSDQDSLNAAAGGNLLNRAPRDALTIIENKLKVRTSRNKPVVLKARATTSSSTPAYLPEITALTDTVKAMLLQNKTPSPALVKAIEEICVICRGLHPYYECLATDSNTFNAFVATGTYNQGGPGYCPQGKTNYHTSNKMRPPGFPQPNMQKNQNRYNQNQGYNQKQGNNFNQGNQNYQAPLNQTQVGPLNDFLNYMKTNNVNMRAMQNQISNMKTKLKNEFKTTMMNQNNKLKNMMSSFFQMHSPSGSGSFPSNTISNPRDALLHMPKFASTFKSLLSNKEKLFKLANTLLNKNCSAVLLKKLPKKLGDPDVTCEEYAQEVLGFLDSSKSVNPTPSSDPIIVTSSPSLTPFEGGDFILEEIEACLTSDSIPSGIDDADFNPKGDILLLEKLLNDDPSYPLPSKEIHFEELKIIKSSIYEPPELELKDLPPHLEYAF
nr:reverse transcriptase domain-containing protein [Tanacetum cinerariifolium]